MIEFRNKKTHNAKLKKVHTNNNSKHISCFYTYQITFININTSSSNQNHQFDVHVHEQINSLNQISHWHTNYHIF